VENATTARGARESQPQGVCQQKTGRTEKKGVGGGGNTLGGVGGEKGKQTQRGKGTERLKDVGGVY